MYSFDKYVLYAMIRISLSGRYLSHFHLIFVTYSAGHNIPTNTCTAFDFYFERELSSVNIKVDILAGIASDK